MNIQPEGDDLRKAVKWIAEHRLENPEKRISALVQAASIRYNLSPRDEAFLLRFLREKEGKGVS